MLVIREARGDDFERVYPLLLEFKNPHLTKEDWRQLFIDHSGLQNDCFGWLLADGDNVVGFAGTILSERIIRGEKMRFCNVSGWIVRREYRSHSLALHAKAIADQSLVITNLSPTAGVLVLLKRLGFTVMDKSQRIVLPVPTPRALSRRCQVLTAAGAVQRALRGESLRFFHDHQLPHNRHMLLRTPGGDCYVMMNRSLKTVRGNLRLPFARVHHIEAPDIFVRYLAKAAVSAAVSFGAVAMIVDDRMLRGAAPWYSFMRPDGRLNAAFRSDKLVADDIDSLYTEAVLLNY